MKSWSASLALALLTAWSTVTLAAVEPGDKPWHRVVGLLQYLEGDYPAAVASGSDTELAEQRGFADEVVRTLPAQGANSYRARAEAIRASIEQHGAPGDVSAACHSLALDIIREQGLTQAPRDIPDVTEGAALFQSTCSSCHGVLGDGQSPVAVAMNPKPANFHDAEVMATLTPYKVFNTTTFGITGTLMPPFPSLTDAQRWSVAFYIFTLREKPCNSKPPHATLEQLAMLTDQGLGEVFGAAQVSCLRRVMPTVDERASLHEAIAGIDRALAFSKEGHHDLARRAIVDAYLTGVEPVEPTLRARDPELVNALEHAFTAARLKAQQEVDIEPEVRALKGVLQRAATHTSVGTFWSVFITALFIVLREGFEASIVVGALLAVLRKMGALEQTRVVHLGWVSALLFSAVAYGFGQHLLAGANREWLETVVSLFAVFMLLYAALWLNARSNISRFMGEMREKMKTALGSGNSLGLFLIAFTSVGRETLEAALFLEGLGGDSPAGASWGAVTGLGALLAFVAFVRKVGFVLPMKTLFKASTVLLIATAVMLVGKGFHGLQELGILPLRPVPFFTLDALGIFADAYSLLPQLILACAPFGWWLVQRHKRSAAVQSGATRLG